MEQKIEKKTKFASRLRDGFDMCWNEIKSEYIGTIDVFLLNGIPSSYNDGMAQEFIHSCREKLNRKVFLKPHYPKDEDISENMKGSVILTVTIKDI